MKELISFALYNEPVYAQQEYCTILDTISCEQVLEQLSAWLDMGEEISIVVDEGWPDGSLSTILG